MLEQHKAYNPKVVGAPLSECECKVFENTMKNAFKGSRHRGLSIETEIFQQALLSLTRYHFKK